MPSLRALAAAGLLVLPLTGAYRNSTARDLFGEMALKDDCPKCPSCFNCNTESDVCKQFAPCNKYNGQCACPPGYGGDDCSVPLCGALSDGSNREPRQPDQDKCECKDGWGGINCNVCQNDRVCDALMPEDEDGVRTGGICYKEPLAVKKNYQMCDVVNQPILDQLDGQIPQVTFSCKEEDETCNFEFWVDQVESFYCALDSCSWSADYGSSQNITTYSCEHIKCLCVPGRMLCGKDGSVDIGDFLVEEIKGPAKFVSTETEGGSSSDGSVFDEPAMNQLITDIFGDPSIKMTCDAGECMYRTEVPGYVKPIPKINTPVIAGVIAGSGLFFAAIGLLFWHLARRSFDRHGQIFLEDSDDETARLLADHKPASLQFENVSYHLNGKPILNEITGMAQPGQITAIMGASGAGKTTFLDILARKNKRGTTTGQITVNGEFVSDQDFKSVIGFVDQEDAMLPTLTVHETILTSALLRLPRDMSRDTKIAKVFEVEKQLGIYHIRDQLIGSEGEGKGRGISGGEKRRVGIACELVTSPSILFLDEPTSGLDAFNAFNVIECLLTLAKDYSRTVIFTIHQPRSNIVALFDQLILLAKGRTVYSGLLESCQEYFESIGYSCPPGYNIADYLVDLTMNAGENAQYQDTDPASPPRTASSSVRAIKSIASTMSVSGENHSGVDSPSGSSRRPNTQSTVRQANSSGVETPETVRTEDDEAPDAREQENQWLRLSRGANVSSRMPELESNLDQLSQKYADSTIAKNIRSEITSAVQLAAAANGVNSNQNSNTIQPYARIGLTSQFVILSKRTWKNLYRNPMLMLAHYAIAILVAVMCGFLFYGLTSDIPGFQNRLGLIFFLLALLGFSTLTSLVVFSSERLIFLRERANGYYKPIVYFVTKVIFDIVPLRIIPPIIIAIIVYPMTGLQPHWGEFLKFLLVLVLFNLTASVICLFIGIIFREAGLANLVGSLHMLFSLLFAGFLLNREALPPMAAWLQKISMFHYGFEALIVNEVRGLRLIDHKYGLDIEVPGASILSSFGFKPLDYWRDVLGLTAMSGAMLVIAYAALHFFLVEKR